MKKNGEIFPTIKTANSIQGFTPIIRKKSNSISNLIKQVKYNNASHKLIKNQIEITIKPIINLKLQPLTRKSIIFDQNQKIDNIKLKQIYVGSENIKKLSYHTTNLQKLNEQIETEISKFKMQSQKKQYQQKETIDKYLMTQQNQEEQKIRRTVQNFNQIKDQSLLNFKHYYSKSIQQNVNETLTPSFIEPKKYRNQKQRFKGKKEIQKLEKDKYEKLNQLENVGKQKQKQKNESQQQRQIQISPWKIDNQNTTDIIFQFQT